MTTTHQYTPTQLADMLKWLSACQDEITRIDRCVGMEAVMAGTGLVSLGWLARRLMIPALQHYEQRLAAAFNEYHQIEIEQTGSLSTRPWQRTAFQNEIIGEALHEYKQQMASAWKYYVTLLFDTEIEEWIEFIEAELLGEDKEQG